MIVDSINLPLLGSREEDYICFQYLIREISATRAEVLIPRWVAHREFLRPGDLIDFHMTFRIENAAYEKGRIEETRWSDADDAQIGLALLEPAKLEMALVTLACQESCYFVETAAGADAVKELLDVIKKTILLKKGIIIYLDRLIPYFSRMSDFPAAEYTQLREFFLADIQQQVLNNQTHLESMIERLKVELREPRDIPRAFDLEEIRSLIESEISIDLFRITFDNEKVTAYMRSIKELEKKLYTQYNYTVLLYIRAL